MIMLVVPPPMFLYPKSTLYLVLTMLGLTTNLKLCLDAGDSASYSSGQSWLDRSGGGYDFFRGGDGSATATDPTFNGTPGGRSLNEYWSLDGGDYFTYDATSEAWMDNIHKDGAKWWACGWVYLPSFGTAVRLLGNNQNGAAGKTGFRLGVSTAGILTFQLSNAGTNQVVSAPVGTAFSTNAWQFFCWSQDETAGTGYVKIGDAVPEAITTTYSSPGTGAASHPLQIGAGGNNNGPVLSGSRIAQIAMAEGASLTADQMEALFQATRGQFGV